jgi:hypothetical protein
VVGCGNVRWSAGSYELRKWANHQKCGGSQDSTLPNMNLSVEMHQKRKAAAGVVLCLSGPKCTTFRIRIVFNSIGSSQAVTRSVGQAEVLPVALCLSFDARE